MSTLGRVGKAHGSGFERFEGRVVPGEHLGQARYDDMLTADQTMPLVSDRAFQLAVVYLECEDLSKAPDVLHAETNQKRCNHLRGR
jgi:hypothetical protein